MENCIGIGNLIKNYKILSILEKNESFFVYLAKDIKEDQKYILKKINLPLKEQKDLDRFKSNFYRVCSQLLSLEHKSIHAPSDFFYLEEKGFFLVYKHLQGRYLGEILKENKRPNFKEKQVKSWAKQLLDAIEYLHAQYPQILVGIILPDSLSLSPMGTLRIMDLGISIFFSKERQKETLIKEYPGYVSPEVIKGGEFCSTQSDVYALGVLFYYLLTGKNPRRKTEPLTNFGKINPDISKDMVDVVLKAVSPEPIKRFKTVREFRRTLIKENEEGDYPEIKSSVKEIYYKNYLAGSLIQGTFTLSNVGKGYMHGFIKTDYSWLKTFPDRFGGNQENIRYLIDTAYMQPGQIYENVIKIKTSRQELEIPVKVQVNPKFLKSLKTLSAIFIMLLIPLIYLGLLELFRFFVIKVAWDQVFLKYNLLSKGSNFLIKNKELLIRRMTFPPGVIILSKLYGLLVIFMPYFVPFSIGKIMEKLKNQVIVRTYPFAIIIMMIPSLILSLLIYLNITSMDILINPYMKYLDPSRYIQLFVAMNLLTTFMMALPKDNRNLNFIDNYIFVKILFYLLIAGYFITSIFFLVIK